MYETEQSEHKLLSMINTETRLNYQAALGQIIISIRDSQNKPLLGVLIS